MFGIGFSEIIIILVIALIVVGPERLPEISRAMGDAYREFQKSIKELKETIEEDNNDDGDSFDKNYKS